MIDLRSDTVTQPTTAMREAMLAAPLGDDVFGDDPSVNALQDKVAHLLGFEAALLMPTGTQSNLCGILAHCQRGDEYLVGSKAHTYRYEGGGAAVLGSVQPQPINQLADGTLLLADIAAAIKPDDAHFARSRLLTLENTWNGQVLPMDYIKAATDLAQQRGLMRHLDGARLFNAAVFQAGVDQSDPYAQARRIAQHFDSASVCFSKGLGAPVGSALCGSREFIARAHRIRKMAGGGMRQAGLLAAAAHYALDHHVERLALDHKHAARLAQGLAQVFADSDAAKRLGAAVEASPTNIVFVKLPNEATTALLDHLKAQGILATGLIGLRFVTHLNVNAEDMEQVISAAAQFFNTPHLTRTA